MNVLYFLTYGISFSPFKTGGQYSLELLSSADLHYACHLQPQSVSRDLLRWHSAVPLAYQKSA